ncbi:cytochrome c oxidase biogenesis-related protein [Ceraceosorus bombacis]|uniref:Cytochrome c oxidase biogenesis-related protein n=1 Tax=Ceraceosorus bombacis TaxID=401625 RepID=A0A0P1BFZ4_9BASI|nr:cytochrome c oxidase biogenesis-related protein [Ceraceosorus bombacis]
MPIVPNAVAQTGRKAEKPGDAPVVQEEESLRSKIVGNALRLLAICFVIISSQVPSALLIYWLSSAFFTLCQTGTLAAIDRRRARNLTPTPSPPPTQPMSPRFSGTAEQYGRAGIARRRR